MKAMLTSLMIFSVIFLAHGTVPRARYNWAKDAGELMRPLSHHEIPFKYPPNWGQIRVDAVLAEIIQDTWYQSPKHFDLLKPLGNFKGKTQQETFENFNNAVNTLFKYYSGPVNYWYSEPPRVALALGFGDCKSYAYYKYWALRQMGYDNVKLVDVIIPDGTGSLSGHVVVILNDLWVFDINAPYVYPVAILRYKAGLEEVFLSDGSVEVAE